MPRLPTRISWLLAATSGLWATTLLVLEWPNRWLLAFAAGGWYALAAWLAGRHHPWPGVLLTAAGTVTLGVLGLPPENAASLAPEMIVLLVTGYLLPWRAGIWSVPAILLAIGPAARWYPPSMVFGGLILLMAWAFGALVRARDGRRRAAAEEAMRLERVDPGARARSAADTEREEVATAALAVVGVAVARMTTGARDARGSLDRNAIEDIHHVGTEATKQLRALLVVLRNDAAPVDSDRSDGARPENAPGTIERSRWSLGALSWRALARLAWPAALMLASIVLSPVLMHMDGGTDHVEWPPLPIVALVALPIAAAIVLRTILPVASLVTTTVLLLLSAALDVLDVIRDGLWMAIAGAVLSWSAGRAGSRSSTVAWLALVGTSGALVTLRDPSNLPIQLALHVLPFAAGTAWAGHYAVEAIHRDEARLRQVEIETAERAAVSEARLQLARDLHDAASHAVGTMMMQANAARVLSQRDPVGALAALDAIIEIGTEAAHELREMIRPVDASNGRAPATSSPSSTSDLTEQLGQLVTAAERAGSTVTTKVTTTTDLADDDIRLLLRVVREGLTNATRHAPGSDIVVELDTSSADTLARVTNGPAREKTGLRSATGSGLGLRGLGELVDARHGHLEVGTLRNGPDAGFVLTVTFPTSVLATVAAPQEEPP